MDDPTLNPELLYRPKEFSDQIVQARIKQLLDTLNSVPMSESEEEALIEETSMEIAQLLALDKYIDGMADVIGYASYTGPEDDDQTGEPEVFSIKDLYFDGVKVVKPSGEAEYRALLVFSEEIETPIDVEDEDTSATYSKFYFLRPGDLVLIDPGAFERHTGEQLRQHLERYALQSEVIVNSNTFKSATGEAQKNMLIKQAEKASEFVESQYYGDTIAMISDTYTMMWPGEDGPNIQHVSPANSKGNRMTQITGKTDGCMFFELFTETWDKPVTGLVYDHPVMVVQNDESDIVYLVPLRSVNDLEVIKTTF